MILETIESWECFKWFVAISRIPHGSHDEKKLSNWLVKFAEERGFAVIQDALGNVCIRKPASRGMEKAPTVILQGHMDMVCVKEDGLKFDFSKDSISLKIVGDFLRANGTSLGADNGVALSYMLALLDAKDVSHPPLEILITVREEVGMDGAAVFDVTSLIGEFFINIDSEKEGVFCVSCAGGRRSAIILPIATVPISDLEDGSKNVFFRINLEGLAGGHSGMEINKQRGNANRLMGRTLATLAESFKFHLANIEGGSASNVISSESSALICFKGEIAPLETMLAEIAATFRHELLAADGANLRLTLVPAESQPYVFSEATFVKTLDALILIPDGVASMDISIAGQDIVESSSNLGQVALRGGSIIFECLIRSSVSSRRDFLYSQVAAVARLIGGEVTYFSEYPAWEYSPESRLRDTFHKVYASLFGKEAKDGGIHAGLECGIFYDKFKAVGRHVDFIAFGPDITGAHTTREAVNILSVERTWRFLLEVLRELGTIGK